MFKVKKIFLHPWFYVFVTLGIAAIFGVVFFETQRSPHTPELAQYEMPHREHLDHSNLITKKFMTGQEVTAACLKCHPDAAKEIMQTAHWKWLKEPVTVPGHSDKKKIGKRNLINNFCIGIKGNWASCTKCHAGYGWKDSRFDFEDETAVDCLVCHDWSGTYAKGPAGIPLKSVNLTEAAKSVGYPKRNNCGVCHSFGGGGMGVKHGDLDASLNYPTEFDDVHMGKHEFLCIDCHQTQKHQIPGTSMSVSVNRNGGVFCSDCHQDDPHKDERINSHLDSVACETCHIPTYAKRNPTKTFWDWSTAGDMSRAEDPHHYLKVKGSFEYDSDITPIYKWYNGFARRYLLGDKINPNKTTEINSPIGNIKNHKSKIHPFKIHTAVQPYDAVNNTLVIPTTSGEGGFWHEFDWNKAISLGAESTGLPFGGKYGFAKTDMFWPLSHMVTPKSEALTCVSCHSKNGRLNWLELGYQGDPIRTGGRK